MMTIKKMYIRFYKILSACGIQVLPVHYSTPVPNLLDLERTKEVWAQKSELPGIDIDLDEQISNLRTVCLPYIKETFGIYDDALRKDLSNSGGFTRIDSMVLHCVVRHFKPSRVIEIGAGVTTYCILQALEENSKDFKFTSIEPYPRDGIKKLSPVELIPKKAQMIPIEAFQKLGEGDLLFIDSSHSIKVGSDVNYLILEVLPRLHPGVIVHFHDIYFPYDYQPNVLNTVAHSSETSLLRAFLTFNPKIKIMFSLSLLHHECTMELKQLFPNYTPVSMIHGIMKDRAHEGDYPVSIFLEIL